MAEKDYYSFEDVLKDLSMEEDELKRLVSAGEIRAFRDNETMRFKAEDVERLKDQDDELDDLDLELDLGDDAEFELEETDLEDDGGDLVIEDLDDLLDEPEEIDLVEAAEELEVEELDLAPEKPARRGRGAAAAAAAAGSAAGAPRASRKVGAAAREEDTETEGGLMVSLLVVGAAILLFANFVVFSAVAGSSNATNSWLVDLFAK